MYLNEVLTMEKCMKEIKNIIFDVGNVLIAFDPLKWLMKTYEDFELVELLYKEVFQSEEWKLLDQGTITDKEAYDRVARRLPGLEQDVERILFHWESFLIEEMTFSTFILKKLKAMGYKLYALSNYPERGFENTEKFYPFFSLFDGKVVSYACGEMKPDEKIYEILLDQYQLDPKECVFIDDTLANVETARRLGMEAVHYFHSNHLMDLYLKLKECEKK